jgi:hypothetical protein
MVVKLIYLYLFETTGFKNNKIPLINLIQKKLWNAKTSSKKV